MVHPIQSGIGEVTQPAICRFRLFSLNVSEVLLKVEILTSYIIWKQQLDS